MCMQYYRTLVVFVGITNLLWLLCAIILVDVTIVCILFPDVLVHSRTLYTLLLTKCA